MAKRKSKKDSVFGELTHVTTDLWERPIELKLFGKVWTVPLRVNIDEEEGLEDNQIRAYTDFAARTAALMKEAEQAIFDYYQSVCGEYRSRYGIVDAKDETVPVIKSVTDLARLVEPEGIIFRYARHNPTFGLLCQCSWEKELGLAVKFENGKAVKAGVQDIVL